MEALFIDRLSGKVAVITGAAQGLGFEIAKAFVRESATVVLTDINEEKLEDTTNSLKDSNGNVSYLALDVTDESEWEDTIEKVVDKYGRLDILVNNAGLGLHGNVETTTYDEWKKVLDVNLNGVFLGMKYGTKAMLDAENGGSIINMSSDAGITGNPELYAYSASKGAVKLMTKSAALHLAEKKPNIRVNSIHPGYMNTDLINEEPNPEAVIENIPMKKLGNPEMIGHAAVYLASDESSFSTGSELVIDGGATAE